MEKGISHCVQCEKEMPFGTDGDGKFIPVCSNPRCSIFGILQIGIEGMRKVKEEGNKDE